MVWFWLWALRNRSVETHFGNTAVKIWNTFWGGETQHFSCSDTWALGLLFACFTFWFILKFENGSSIGRKQTGTRVQLCEPEHILTGEWVCRFPGLSHFSTPPRPTQSKLILDAERRTNPILLKGGKHYFIEIISAPLGVLPSFIWSKTNFLAVPRHPHLEKEAYELVKMWPHHFDIILLCFPALHLPFCARLWENRRNFREQLD